jgi:hypothetical protein
MMIWAVGACFAGQQAQDPCAEDKLPAAVLQILEEKFSGWRVERTGDLEAYYRQLWLKVHPNDCPGIAIGHFCSERRLSFALLLVPRNSGKSGYKLLAIVEETRGHDTTHLLEDENQAPSTGVVVDTVPPGEYSEPEGENRVRIILDGIYAEQLEVGAILFYWRGGRFHGLITSE